MCDADHVNYRAQNLHQHIADLIFSNGKQFLEAHSDKNLLNEG